MNRRLASAVLPVASVMTAVSLLLPWSRSGHNDRSSLELLRTAGVLDVVSVSTRWLLVGAWYLIIVLVAVSFVAAGWGYQRVAALAGVPLGLAMVVAAGVVQQSALPLRWGALVGCGAGLTATVRSGVILMHNEFQAEGRAE